MSIQITNVKVLSNPSKFTDPFKFLITFDCVAPGIKGDLEWKLVYVGSADNEDKDQELDSVFVGPVHVGKSQFVFEAPAPDVTKIPQADLLDVTVILLTCSYNGQEFIRIGYYVNNEYNDSIEDSASTDKTKSIDVGKISRFILQDKPRVTRFVINWDQNKEPDQPTEKKCDKLIFFFFLRLQKGKRGQ
ncbi:hypothetical protein RFI_06229 [Reticulomyxa filosa]|uniref:Anti-silencing function protein 1 n=1 Tax=Reticulomyxa filosa TaxID=46433 RepID=X6P051_RETFI|nr:hypothetical protein RFI_06229 [Reticulomyxa filosa]|eukprot:ETO30892.1 hypothetical protein RFI_06229 [Reticulomyxa filosa]